MNQKSNRLSVLACFSLTLLITSCTKQSKFEQSPSPEKKAQKSETIAVAAAANLKFAFEEIESAFEQLHPNLDVVVTYGSSGNFFAQLSQNAPFDVFFSADTKYPQQLIEAGVTSRDSYFSYASGRLVVWVPNDSLLDMEKLGIRAVIDPSVTKLAIANPRLAPYGAAAVEALKTLGVYDEAKERFVFGENITQTAQFVESGAADAGVVALSLALSPEMRVKGRYWIIPDDAYPPIVQAAVIPHHCHHPQAARFLREFVLGQEGQAILSKFGYLSAKD